MQGPSMDERTHWWTQLPAKFVGEWNASSMDNVRHSCIAANLVAVFNNMQCQMKSGILGKDIDSLFSKTLSGFRHRFLYP